MNRLVSLTLMLGAFAVASLPGSGFAESPSRDCGATTGYQTNAPWPGRSRCPTGIGLSPYEGPNDSFVAFNPTVGSVQRGAAIAADGSIYVGNTAGQLYKFNASGVQQWVRSGLGAIRTTPAIAASGRIYVASDAGRLWAIDPATGNTIWSCLMTGWGLFYANVPMHGSPVIAADGAIIVSNDAGLVQAVNPTGTPRWTIQMNGPVYMTAALSRDGGTVYVGSPGLELRAYAVSNGALRWISPLLVGGGTPAVTASGYIVVPSSAGLSLLYAVDPLTGLPSWPVPLGFTSIFDKSPSIAPNGDIVIASDQGVISAITQTGAVRWARSFGLFTKFTSAAIDALGTVYVSTQNGTIRALRGDTGATIWEYAAGGTLSGLPALNAKNQLIVPVNNKLFGFGRAGRWGTLDDPPPPTQPQAPGLITQSSNGDNNSNTPIPPQIINGGVPGATVDVGAPPPAPPPLYATGLRQNPSGPPFRACTENAQGREIPVPNSSNLETLMLSNSTTDYSALKTSLGGDGCGATPAPALCPIDPASFAVLNRTCVTDSNCINGAVCALDCQGDGECTNGVKRCGYTYAQTGAMDSCGGLPAVAANTPFPVAPTGNEPAPCIEFRECMYNDDLQHHPYDDGLQYLDCGGTHAPVDTNGDGWLDSDPDCDGDTALPEPPPAPAETPMRVGARCTLAQENPGARQANNYDKLASMNESGERPAGSPSKKWDLVLGPKAFHKMDFQPKPFGRSFIDSQNEVNFDMRARLNGKDYKLFDLGAQATLKTCEITTSAHAKLFGNLIDLQIGGPAFARSTNTTDASQCQSLVTNANAWIHAAKGSMIGAKNALAMFKPDIRNPALAARAADYPGVPGLPTTTAITLRAATPSRQACEATLFPDLADALIPPVVTAAQCAAAYTPQTAANIVNTYINRYNTSVILASTAIASERDRLMTQFAADTGRIPLINDKQQFRQTFVNATFPIGPIPLNLEIEGSGHYGISGDFQYFARFVESNGWAPGVGAQLRAGPFAGVSVLAFVGVGFDLGVFAAKVGIAGTVNLVEIRAPLYAGIALQRAEGGPDTRTPLDSTASVCGGAAGCGFGPPYNINPFLDLNPKKYRWDLSYNLGAEFKGTALSGEIDVRARVRFLFFSKTWKKRFVKIKGFSLGAKFAVEDTAGALPKIYDLGSLVPEITFPQLPTVTAAQFPTAAQLTIGGWAENVTNPTLQNFVKRQLDKVRPGTAAEPVYTEAIKDYAYDLLSCFQ